MAFSRSNHSILGSQTPDIWRIAYEKANTEGRSLENNISVLLHLVTFESICSLLVLAWKRGDLSLFGTSPRPFFSVLDKPRSYYSVTKANEWFRE